MSAEIAVVGGRGKTGQAVISALHVLGVSAQPLGRTELAEPLSALAGFSAVYVMAPNMHPDEAQFVSDILAAARDAGISRVVYHSVAAPYVPEMPHHLGKAESERLVRTSGVDWTILQPCAYIQNFLPQLTGAEPADEPEIAVPYDLDRLFGLVDLQDVGEIAARALTDLSLIGSTLELGGPELVSVRDVARVASDVLEREVPVAAIPSAEWAEGPGAELDSRERDWLLAMFAYYEKHGLPVGGIATAAILKRQPHSVADVLRRELTATS